LINAKVSMKIAYFDCFAGASGDMIVGALIDAGVDFGRLKEELKKLHLHGYRLHATKKPKSGFAAVKFDVELLEAHDHDHDHDRAHGRSRKRGHDHRNLEDIVKILDESGLSKSVKEKSKEVFRRLAGAEAAVHGCAVNEIHFHEVGAVDAIVDIVGSVIGLDLLGVGEIRASGLHLGSGFVDCAHGRLPVPPPAVVELLKGIPAYSTDVKGELVTPTGAAILSTLAAGFGPFPEMRIEKTGYGAGFKDLSIPNVLRLVIGESEPAREQDRIRMIETNIDDMNPQFYEYIMEKLFSEGARDVFLTPIIMKKSRPGLVLSVLATEDRIEALIGILLRETTTLGVRISDFKKRMILGREIVSMKTEWGVAHVKIRSISGSERTIAPEYDDCKRISREFDLPIQTVFDAIKREAESRLLPVGKKGVVSKKRGKSAV
jgi:pyridinium-3,5-bisthiocarboxylic acid mononucleotide nickel chelatase